MWEQRVDLIEGQKYEVMDNQKFVHFAKYENGKFINPVTKQEIKNIVRIWQ